MPVDKELSGDKAEEKWITVGGKKMRIPAGEEGEELVRTPLPSLRGAKESNTKEAQKSDIYKMRFDLIKSQFKIREPVVFAEYKKSGIVQGINGGIVNILCEGRIYPINKTYVFKKSELLGERHWDTMTNINRVEILKICNLPAFYNKQNWGNLAVEIRTTLLKYNRSYSASAGLTTNNAGIMNPIYNPLNEEKSVDDRIKEEIKRQHNEQYEGEEEVDGNGKDSKNDSKNGSSHIPKKDPSKDSSHIPSKESGKESGKNTGNKK